jgi:hypothetical protein
MRKLYVYLLLSATTVFVFSCQKEVSSNLPGSGNGGSLTGTWKFINVNAATESIVEERDGSDVVKTITTSNYTSENNTGTIKFDANTLFINGLGYSINAVAKTYIYDNGSLLDSLQFPLTLTVPPTSSESKYKQVSSDSLYLEGGAIFNTSGGPVTSQGQGVKLKFVGDKLIMVSKLDQVKTVNMGGIIQTQQTKATSTVTYQKQ